MTDKYITLIGHVQSGKTAEEINYCWDSVKSQEIPVVFVVRNITADQLQLRARFKPFDINVKTLSSLNIESAAKFMETPGVLILLCNKFQIYKMKKVLQLYRGEYNLCIDEVDFSIKSKDNKSKVDQLLLELKESAKGILGATATPIALFNDFSITKIKKMVPGKNYCGIETIKVNYLTPNITNEPLTDAESIELIYNSLLEKDHAILLHNVNKTRKYHKKLLHLLSDIYPQFTVLTYNGDGIKVLCKNRPELPFCKKKSINNYGQMINKYYHLGEIHLFENFSISEVLQVLKDDLVWNHTHISIIAGNLASRGITFVSSDYSLHLTDQYFHVNSSHGENMLQSLRLLGCYTDSVPLTLWCTEKNWKCILEHNLIINKLVTEINESKEWIFKLQQVNIIKPENPFTRASVNPEIIRSGDSVRISI